jgi:hypothetical protein
MTHNIMITDIVECTIQVIILFIFSRGTYDPSGLQKLGGAYYKLLLLGR